MGSRVIIKMAQFVIGLAFAATLLHAPAAAAAADIVVGGSTGWTIPPNSNFYSTWASSNTFKVGDTLVFNFAAGAHDVSVVTKQAYDGCNTGSAINRITNGPARVSLNSAGEHYYICGFPGHCAAGQKLAINVVAADSGSDTAAPPPSGTAPSDTPSSTQAPPPANTAASSSRGVGFAAVLMFIVLGLFY